MITVKDLVEKRESLKDEIRLEHEQLKARFNRLVEDYLEMILNFKNWAVDGQARFSNKEISEFMSNEKIYFCSVKKARELIAESLKDRGFRVALTPTLVRFYW